MKYEDPTKARIARDNEERRKAKERGSNSKEKQEKARKAVKDIFREAAGKGPSGPVKTNAAGYRASAVKPRRVK